MRKDFTRVVGMSAFSLALVAVVSLQTFADTTVRSVDGLAGKMLQILGPLSNNDPIIGYGWHPLEHDQLYWEVLRAYGPMAQSLYGDPDKIFIRDFQGLRMASELNITFGSPQGYRQHNWATDFERFLIENPEGGLVIFKGMSRLDGLGPVFAKRIYPVLSSTQYKRADGTSTILYQKDANSPVRAYDNIDISKFTFLFLGEGPFEIDYGINVEKIAKRAPLNTNEASGTYIFLRMSELNAILDLCESLLKKPL